MQNILCHYPFHMSFPVVIPLQRASACKEQFQRKFVFAKDISCITKDSATYYANTYVMHGLHNSAYRIVCLPMFKIMLARKERRPRQPQTHWLLHFLWYQGLHFLWTYLWSLYCNIRIYCIRSIFSWTFGIFGESLLTPWWWMAFHWKLGKPNLWTCFQVGRRRALFGYQNWPLKVSKDEKLKTKITSEFAAATDCQCPLPCLILTSCRGKVHRALAVVCKVREVLFNCEPVKHDCFHIRRSKSCDVAPDTSAVSASNGQRAPLATGISHSGRGSPAQWMAGGV